MMTRPSGERPDDEVLVDYLLGRLSTEDTERVDELSVADDDVAWRLQGVENDLVDAYVAGQLSGDRLERFTSFYLTSPMRRRRVELARALRSQTTRRAPAVPSARRPVPRPVLPQWALAAAALVAAVGLAYFALENRRLRDQVSQSDVARAAGEQALAGARSELEQERSTGEAMRTELERMRATPPAERSSIQALVLLPLRRGAGEVPTVSIARGTGHLPLRLRLEGDAFSRYEAALRDSAAGRIVWRSGPIESGAGGEDRTLLVEVPVAQLQSAGYTLELRGSRRNAAEFVTSYAFRVVVE